MVEGGGSGGSLEVNKEVEKVEKGSRLETQPDSQMEG